MSGPRSISSSMGIWGIPFLGERKGSTLGAIDLKMKYRLSFWDALILEAARRSGATTFYSEDLSHGQQVGGLVIVNPFEP